MATVKWLRRGVVIVSLMGPLAAQDWVPATAGAPAGTAMDSLSVSEAEKKAQARNYFETGLMLYNQRQFEESERHFEKAIARDPSLSEARDYLARAKAAQGDRHEEVSEQAGWIQRNKQVQEEELKIKLDHRIQAARGDYEALQQSQAPLEAGERLQKLTKIQGDFSEALELSRALPHRMDTETYGKLVEGYLRAVSDDITETKAEIAAEQRERAKQIHLRELQENQKYIDNKIARLIQAIEEDIASKKYAAAVKLAEDVLDMDPLNKKARKLRNKAESLRHTSEGDRIEDLRSQELTRKVIRIKDSGIPYTEYVVYPEDWEEISQRQKRGLAKKREPEWKLKILQLMEQVLNYNCPGLPLDQVLTQLSEITGVNILLDPAVRRSKDAEDLFVPPFRFQGMKFKHIVSWVAQKGNLTWVLKDDAVLVTSPDSASDRLITQVYDMQDLLAPKQNFTPPELSIGSTGDKEGAINFEEPAAAAEGAAPTGEALLSLIKQTVPGRWEVAGSGVVITQLEGSGAILVKNTPEIHNQVIELLETLRRSSSMQVEVEARKLIVQKGFFRDIGVDWRGIDNGDRLTEGGDPQPGFVYKRPLSSIKGGIFNNVPASDTASANFGFLLEHSILDKFQARMLLRVLEENKTLSELISPRIVLMNNVSGYIRLVRKQYYISNYTQGGSGLQPDLADIDQGELLQVRATISSDRKYITLQVQPDFQGVDLTTRGPVFIRGGGSQGQSIGVGGQTLSFVTLDQELPVDLPILQRVRVRTVAVIPDGGILIIGGVAESNETSLSAGVPILSKIPILGRLFRSDSNKDSTKDAMLIVNGAIIITEELEAEL